MADGLIGFDHLEAVDARYNKSQTRRMELRSRFVIEPHLTDIAGAEVLDLACHDGRWSYAFAEAGAKSVTGIEGRPDLVQKFSAFPDGSVKQKVNIYCGDLFDFLENLIRNGRTFDVVAVLGIFYHVTEHFRLLKLIERLAPRLILVDGIFLTSPLPVVRFGNEDPGVAGNAISFGNGRVPVGVASRRLLEMMAACLSYSVEWADWETLPPQERGTVADYFRKGVKRRCTCALRPLPVA